VSSVGAPIAIAKRSRWKRFVRVVIVVAAAVLGGSAFIVRQVRRYQDRIYVVETAPSAPVAIVFGAAGEVLHDRVQTGVVLYHAGKVRKLLMTGDNGRVGYNEPETMKEEAMRMGVPARDIVCDYAGFRTYDSLYRARDIFGVDRALLVTQRYHLPRALYTGTKLGLDVEGVEADRRRYVSQKFYDSREVMSTVIAWVQVNLTHPRPKYLGKKEPIKMA
jgi:SanA protein